MHLLTLALLYSIISIVTWEALKYFFKEKKKSPSAKNNNRTTHGKDEGF